MRIAICWQELSGYMAACFRALAKDVELMVIAGAPGATVTQNAYSDRSLTDGFACTLLGRDQLFDRRLVGELVAEFRPDVVFVAGWFNPAFMALANESRLTQARFIMGMDTSYKGTWRQRLAKLRLAWLFKRVDRVIVPGERGWQFARLLNVPERKLRRGLYGIDYNRLSAALPMRLAEPGGWPRKFLFVGRYLERKGIDVLLDAYAMYRSRSADPWPLDCCGKGEFADRIAAAPGVNDLGFVQPREQVRILAEHGASILPSRYDPWPLVIPEAAASGLPVICSERCGSSVELVRPYYNGLLFSTADVGSLAGAMHWIDRNCAALAEMGRRGQQLAAPYSAGHWACRWRNMLDEVMEEAPRMSGAAVPLRP